MSRTFWRVEGGEIFKFKKITKKTGGSFSAFSIKVNQGKDKVSDTWRPSGWLNCTAYGAFSESLSELADKTKCTAEGYMVWDESNPQYKGWKYICTHLDADGVEPRVKIKDDDAPPF